MKTRLNTAIVLAANAHDGQFDKAGNPYFLHLMKVMHYTKSEDEDIQIIAVLHDAVEDTKHKEPHERVTVDQIRSLFGDRVADAVNLLSKIRKGETNDEYLAGIMTNIDAMIVKRADLRHNTDTRRLKGLTEKDFTRMKKYAFMYAAIDDRLHELGVYPV